MPHKRILTRFDFSSAFEDRARDYDDEQLRFFEEDKLIVVDRHDTVIGTASKKKAHLRNSDFELREHPHRAFSLFLFNEKNELLMQQRASYKITFPLLWTNTVCSHPLYVADEIAEKEAKGVKRAACRKLLHELNIDARKSLIGSGIERSSTEDELLGRLHYLTRILYSAPSDEILWEHEIDYILFARTSLKAGQC